MSQFIFGNKKSNDDFGLMIVDVVVSNHSVNTITKTIPFMNGQYEFSELYGGQTYSTREVKIIVALNGLVDSSRTRLNIAYDNVINWLFNTGMSTLKIDFIEHNFTGRVISVGEKERFLNSESIEIIFECDPFRVADYYEGHDIWDIFNFETDYAQQTEYSVNGVLSITIYNPGATKITPLVKCSSEMSVTMNNIKYQFPSGLNKDYRFQLVIGENNFKVEGNGTIEFIFKIEVI